MAYTIAALKTELTTDPQSVGYSPYITEGSYNWPQVATMLAATTGAGAATITLPQMSNADFVAAILPYLKIALGINAAFYGAVWQTILQMGVVDFTLPQVQGILAEAISDGVMTSAQAAAINQRVGSRAEALWGADIVVPWGDISDAILKGA